MKIRFLYLAVLIFTLTFHPVVTTAEEYGTDVSGYLGCTVQELLSDFPDLYTDNDRAGSGRDFRLFAKDCG